MTATKPTDSARPFALMGELVARCKANAKYKVRFAIHGADKKNAKVALNGHNDEFFAAWEFLTFGRRDYFTEDPIADVMFWGYGAHPPQGETFTQHMLGEEIGTIFLGCGWKTADDKHRSPFDEHWTNLGDTCAWISAVYLGIAEALKKANRDKPGNVAYLDVEEMLKAAVDNDRRGGGTHYQLTNMITALHFLGMDGRDVMRWAFEAYDALYKEARLKRKGKLKAPKAEKLFFAGEHDLVSQVVAMVLLQEHGVIPKNPLSQILANQVTGETPTGRPWDKTKTCKVLAKYQDDGKTDLMDWVRRRKAMSKSGAAKMLISGLRKHLQAPDGPQSVFGLKRIANAMRGAGVPIGKVVDWLQIAIHARFQTHIRVMGANKIVGQAIDAGQTEERTLVKGGQFRLIYQQTDSTNFQHAALSRGRKDRATGLKKHDFQCSAVMSERGNVSVKLNDAFVKQDPVFADRLHDEITLELRVAELTALGVTVDRNDAKLMATLRRETVVLPLPWFKFRGTTGTARMVFNGSFSHPLVPPTKLTLEQVVRAILAAFNTVNVVIAQ